MAEECFPTILTYATCHSTRLLDQILNGIKGNARIRKQNSGECAIPIRMLSMQYASRHLNYQWRLPMIFARAGEWGLRSGKSHHCGI